MTAQQGSDAGGTVLLWGTMFNRCRARVEPNRSGYWGRCDLRRGHQGDHLLERGMEVLRWSTRWTQTALTGRSV